MSEPGIPAKAGTGIAARRGQFAQQPEAPTAPYLPPIPVEHIPSDHEHEMET